MPIFQKPPKTPPKAAVKEPRIAIIKPAILAENDPTERLQSTLSKAGYAVLVWSDADAAKHALAAHKYDLVFGIDEILPQLPFFFCAKSAIQ